ncbi:hypothetical protein ACIHFE_05690 [Streptomyces sp. NPDC052396]|uniref:hypothetical protein n=1 Tax=Streptomyces sp. NPDC052396 TaxID=3365689 RepID=UPI0037D409AD
MPHRASRDGHRGQLATGALAVAALLATLVALWQTQSGPMVHPPHGPSPSPTPPSQPPPDPRSLSSGL